MLRRDGRLKMESDRLLPVLIGAVPVLIVIMLAAFVVLSDQARASPAAQAGQPGGGTSTTVPTAGSGQPPGSTTSDQPGTPSPLCFPLVGCI